MMYLQTSADILNLVLALAVLWIVFLLSWFLWNAISIVRSIRGTIHELQERLQMIDDVVRLAREKLESTSTYLGLLVDVIREGMSWMRTRESAPTFRKKSVKSKK